jgi:malonate-semialdehyde dehydrogenase (acetylating) / methylmalonate-semialdehyde dehydrogenase
LTNSAKKRSSSSVKHVIGHFIDGREITPAPNGPTADVFNPATGTVNKRVEIASEEALEQAILAAQNAFPHWRDTPPLKRAQILFRFRQLLATHADDICQLITSENGKVLSDARGELTRGIEVVDYACGISELLKGEHSRNAGSNINSWSEFQPLGIVTGITPFNFPAMVPMWMFPLAIACGNTFILKPSEKVPGASILIARLFTEAGLPNGVFNIVNGGKDVVDFLLKDARVQAVSFVGSTPIAESIYQRACATGKRVQALGGAKNHAVLMPDADIDNAVNSLMGAAYGSCGQRCMAISVVVCVGEEIADRLVPQLQKRTQGLKIGPGADTGNDMGPLISSEALARVNSYIEQGLEQKAELIVDGRKVTVNGFEDGYFIGGCLFDEVTEGMTIYQDEIFGPVLCVVRATDLDQAIALINGHQYGNGCCIFTRDGGTARYFSDNVQIGMVGVNVALPVPVASQSFGGWKRSLFGDLYVYGPDAIRFYTRRKTITQKWPAQGAAAEGTKYSFPGN